MSNSFLRKEIMNGSIRIALLLAASVGFSLAEGGALAQPTAIGPGHMQNMMRGSDAGSHVPMAGPTAMLTRQDAGSSADMALVHDLLFNNTRIKRTVTNLPDGIRTTTESDDPEVARSIQAHVASMSQRLEDGREFNIFSTSLPVLFENREKISSKVEMTDKGVVVTRTSTDRKVVAALQQHATEVTDLVREGMVAMRRGMMSRMAMGPRGPQSGVRADGDHPH